MPCNKKRKHKGAIKELIVIAFITEHIQKITEFFNEEISIVNRMLNKLALKGLCLAALGIVLLAIWLYLYTDEDSVNLEILSIMGWVTIWEAASIFIMGMHDLQQLKKGL